MRKANLEENMANNKHRAIHSLKSWLFTPATKTGRFGRAAQVGADILIIDLEDAVAFSDKQKARTAALQYLEQPAERRLPCALRINAPVTRTGIEDLHSLLESSAAPDYIILPKCDAPTFISMVRVLLDQAATATEIIALIESAKEVEALADIVKSDVRPVALLFGAADMAPAFLWPPNARRVVELYQLQEYSLRETAQILVISTCGCKKQACSTQESPCIECPCCRVLAGPFGLTPGTKRNFYDNSN